MHGLDRPMNRRLLLGGLGLGSLAARDAGLGRGR